MPDTDARSRLLEDFWHQLGGDKPALSAVSFTGEGAELPSVYPVSDFAAATVAAATLAVAEWAAHGNNRTLEPVTIDRAHAALAFRSERHIERPGRDWPSLWDPMAGDYPTRDGFIRLHTNYPHHRAAAERVLGPGDDRERVSREIAARSAEAIENDIVGENGCAAAMRTTDQWAAHPQGQAVRAAPTIARAAVNGPRANAREERANRDSPLGRGPLEGLRILDLTRVIAGPTCTRLLAAWGADVLRIDPVGFEEPDALLADTTPGKRCAALDLKQRGDVARFEALVRGADALVVGYRSDALRRLGLGPERLAAMQPRLVRVELDAYGHSGPWAKRRGFDSLVQMSCGIAARGQAVYASDRPRPLPAQALDHGTGYLLAAAVCRALTDRREHGRLSAYQLSLAGTAKALLDCGETGDPLAPDPGPEAARPFLAQEHGPFGALWRVRCPGRIGEQNPQWSRPAGPLGRDAADWPTGPSAPA